MASTKWARISPASSCESVLRSPSTSIASCSVSWSVWRTSRWSGISIGPGGAFSWQAASAGKTAAITSSASMRWIWIGLLRPPRNRSTASARLRFQRQRDTNIGDSSTACSSAARALSERTSAGAESSGKLCCGPSESTSASSLAAACSSKSKVTQKRLRSAKP